MKFVIENGHGGIDPDTGRYVTPGKRMVKDDVEFYEGVNNRLVAKEIVNALKDKGLDAELLFDHWKDLSLGTRVNLANDLYYKNNKKVFLISIHSDAAGNGKEWHDAKGVTTFIYDNAGRKSQEFARIINNELICELFSLTKNRGVRKANFQILRETNCPAILLELGFHTHKEEVKLIQTKKWREKVAQALATACYEIDKIERG
jgi:N-acetylmuramoyl-L-alanine amidase